MMAKPTTRTKPSKRNAESAVEADVTSATPIPPGEVLSDTSGLEAGDLIPAGAEVEFSGTDLAAPESAGGNVPPPDDGAISDGGPDMVLRVIGPPRGRWRAGKHFGPAPTDIAMTGLPDDVLAEIEGDPLLRTERLRLAR